jgi:hypothetical protein
MSQTRSSGKVVCIEVPEELQGAIEEFIKAYQQTPRDISSPQQLDQVEQHVAQACDRLFAASMQPIIQQSIAARQSSRRRHSKLVPTWLSRLLTPAKPMKNQGPRTVHLTLSRGPDIAISTVYYSRNCHRDNPLLGKGCFPALECLGIFDHASPLLASRAALTACLSGSFAEAVQMLQLQGRPVDVKTLRRLVYRFAARSRFNLQRSEYRLGQGESAQGLRLVVALDGGRVRLRTNKRGKKRASKRHGYRTNWREPKLLYIYAIDEKGKKLAKFKPIIDGTFELLAESEELFERLEKYLKALNVEEAKEVIFIGDGAPWVSNRVPKLASALKIAAEKVKVVADFYHAVEHLRAAADGHKKFREKARQAWLKTQRKRLYQGRVDQVIAEIGKLKGKKIHTEKDYFVNRQKHMQYAQWKKAGLPIGSGAVESAIRRIVNLRLKGAGIFWFERNAEHMLLLRCFAKAHRWDNLLPLALRSALLPAL